MPMDDLFISVIARTQVLQALVMYTTWNDAQSSDNPKEFILSLRARSLNSINSLTDPDDASGVSQKTSESRREIHADFFDNLERALSQQGSPSLYLH